MKKAVLWVLRAFFVLWVFTGGKSTLTGLLWPNSPAPWEKVHAFYYPDANDLSEDRRNLDVGSLDACRDWVNEQAIADGDPMQTRSDYECGVGCRNEYDGTVYVCRLTVE